MRLPLLVLALALVLGAERTASLAAVASPAAAAATPAPPWLLVSDVHFNPLDNPSLAGALLAAPASGWHSVFESAPAAPSAYFTDTNYALLKASLAAMRAADPQPPVVLIAGDFLGHEFHEHFASAAPGRREAEYDAFVDKTIAFLAGAFDAAYPDAQFVITLGNNDGYCGDYKSTPQSPFLAHLAQAWAPLVNRRGGAPNFARDVSNAGYYVATLPGAGQAVVLNSVLWSAKYGNACGVPGSDPGTAELDWLAGVAKTSPGAYRWYVSHIPPAIDDYTSLRAGKPVPFMQDAYVRRLVDLTASDTHATAFLLGHLHHASFQIVGAAPNASAGLPGLVVPSISPVQGNNPAFVTADVDVASGTIADTATFKLGVANPSAGWSRLYAFDSAYGATRFDTANLVKIQGALTSDPALRTVFANNYNSGSTVATIVPATWPWYLCGDVNVTAEAYGACVWAAGTPPGAARPSR